MEQHKKNQVETILLKFVSIIKKTLSKWYVSAKAVLYDAQKNTNSNPELRNRIIFGAILFIVSLIIIGVGGVVFNILVMAIALVTMNEMNNIIIGQQLSLESLQKWKLASFAYAFFPQASIMIIRSQEEQGFAVCLWMLCLIVTVDISGFIVGKKFGKRKILPTISPNKTYAGSIAGLIGAVAVSLFFYAIFRTKSEQSFGVVGFVVLGVFLGILSQCGDAIESIIKRRFNIKNSGDIIPGHGGIMDRLDSFLLAAPFVAILLLLKNGILF